VNGGDGEGEGEWPSVGSSRKEQEGEEERANETPYEIQMQWGSESARR